MQQCYVALRSRVMPDSGTQREPPVARDVDFGNCRRRPCSEQPQKTRTNTPLNTPGVAVKRHWIFVYRCPKEVTARQPGWLGRFVNRLLVRSSRSHARKHPSLWLKVPRRHGVMPRVLQRARHQQAAEPGGHSRCSLHQLTRTSTPPVQPCCSTSTAHLSRSPTIPTRSSSMIARPTR